MAWDILQEHFASTLDAKKSLLEDQLTALVKEKSEGAVTSVGRARMSALTDG
jgi:hypothetical protein